MVPVIAFLYKIRQLDQQPPPRRQRPARRRCKNSFRRLTWQPRPSQRQGLRRYAASPQDLHTYKRQLLPTSVREMNFYTGAGLHYTHKTHYSDALKCWGSLDRGPFPEVRYLDLSGWMDPDEQAITLRLGIKVAPPSYKHSSTITHSSPPSGQQL